MNCTIELKEKTIEQGFRTAACIAESIGSEMIINVTGRVKRVVMPALGFDSVIIEIYDKKISVIIPYKGAMEVVDVISLPYIFQQDLFERYCDHIGVKCVVDNNY